jgi:hypothetical protein
MGLGIFVPDVGFGFKLDMLVDVRIRKVERYHGDYEHLWSDHVAVSINYMNISNNDYILTCFWERIRPDQTSYSEQLWKNRKPHLDTSITFIGRNLT